MPYRSPKIKSCQDLATKMMVDRKSFYSKRVASLKICIYEYSNNYIDIKQ